MSSEIVENATNVNENEQDKEPNKLNDKLKLLEEDTNQLNISINEELTKTTTNKKGRPKGAKQKKYSYFIEVYDILNKSWVKLGEYFSFSDMSEQLKTVYCLEYSGYILQNIYNGKTSDQYLRIFHI